MYDHSRWAVETRFQPQLADVFWDNKKLAELFGPLIYVDALLSHKHDLRLFDDCCRIADEIIQRIIDNAS